MPNHWATSGLARALEQGSGARLALLSAYERFRNHFGDTDDFHISSTEQGGSPRAGAARLDGRAISVARDRADSLASVDAPVSMFRRLLIVDATRK